MTVKRVMGTETEYAVSLNTRTATTRCNCPSTW